MKDFLSTLLDRLLGECTLSELKREGGGGGGGGYKSCHYDGTPLKAAEVLVPRVYISTILEIILVHVD